MLRSGNAAFASIVTLNFAVVLAGTNSVGVLSVTVAGPSKTPERL